MVLRGGKYDCHDCHCVFDYEELKIRYDKYGNTTLRSKTCPRCGSVSWSSFEDRKKLEKYIILKYKGDEDEEF